MSKLFDIYSSLKTNERDSNNTLYLFKSGIFFICIDEDAQIASKLFHLKLTHLNEKILKCGFPIKSLDKYSKLIKLHNYNFKIIDISKKEAFTINNYSTNNNITNLLLEISKIDTNNLSIKEAYEFIENAKNVAKKIMQGETNNG